MQSIIKSTEDFYTSDTLFDFVLLKRCKTDLYEFGLYLYHGRPSEIALAYWDNRVFENFVKNVANGICSVFFFLEDDKCPQFIIYDGTYFHMRVYDYGNFYDQIKVLAIQSHIDKLIKLYTAIEVHLSNNHSCDRCSKANKREPYPYKCHDKYNSFKTDVTAELNLLLHDAKALVQQELP